MQPLRKKSILQPSSDKKKFKKCYQEVLNNDTILWIESYKRDCQFDVDNFLQEFLYPYNDSAFLEDILHNKAFAVTGRGAEQVSEFIKEYFLSGDVQELINNTASEDGVSVWLPNAEGGINSHKVADSKLSFELFKNIGSSLYMRAPPETCEKLTSKAFRSVGFPIHSFSDGGSRGEVEVFLASKLSRRTPTHTDFQQNFTFQLLGSKKWRLKQGDIKNPLRAKSPHFSNTPVEVIENQLLVSTACGGTPKMDPPPDDADDWVEIELHPGDVLYHPPGMWHNVQTTKVDPELNICLNVNISLFTPSWADIISWSLRQVLWKNPLLRRPVSVHDYPQMKQTLENIGLMTPLFQTEGLIPPSILNSCEENNNEIDFINWKRSEKTSPAKKYYRNVLAEILLDSDAFQGDAAEEDLHSTFNFVVHVNLGSPDLETLFRFEVTNVPISLQSIVHKIRYQTEIDFKKMQTAKLKENSTAILMDILISCGFLLPVKI